MSIEVLNVEVSDAKELLDIYTPYIIDTAITFEYDVPSVEEFETRIKNISAKYPYIKAVKDGTIVGYAYAGSFKARKAYDWAVETTIYVCKDCKREGIGRVLYAELEKRLHKMGILNVNACIASPVKEDEHLTDDSIRFHEALGYSLVGKFHKCGYKFNTWYDMVWMEKMLGEHINIRKIEAKDNLRVAEIIRGCLIEYGGDHRPDTAWADPYLERFSEVYTLDNNSYWVAENEEGVVVAGVGVGPMNGVDGVCELQKMYCIPEYRGMGIAGRLLETAFEFAKKHYDRCYLETMDNMDRAKNFYEKHGFVHTEETIGSTGHCGCNYHYIINL